MFKIFYSRKLRTNDILTSALYCERTFYRAFLKDIKNSKQQILIESPFITIKRTKVLLPALRKASNRGVKIQINTRNPKHHCKEMEVQAWRSIKALRRSGVKVKIYNDMRHRKISVIDKKVLWEGSLNILSQSNSKELMRRTSSETMARQLLRIVKYSLEV